MTFTNKEFLVLFDPAGMFVDIQGPCTSAVSSFDYQNTSALPSWIYLQTSSATSLQRFYLSNIPFNNSNMVSFAGEL